MTNEVRMQNAEVGSTGAGLAGVPGQFPVHSVQPAEDGPNSHTPNLPLSPSPSLPLSPQGRHFWRTLEEQADTEEFREWLHREFPREASVWDDVAIDRRKFFHLMAASLALAGLSSGCSNQGEEKILPYVRAPEQLVLGKPLHFATAMPRGAETLGIVVTSREGRPIKIEGNELHPASLGATDAWAQASVLSLYDPDRSQTVMHLGEISTWEAFLTELREHLDSLARSGGKGIFVLSESVSSPTLARQKRAFHEKYPNARWFQYEPINRDSARQGAQLAFGRDATPLYDFQKAKLVLSLDSDFLCRGPGSVRYARHFMAGRAARGEQPEMNRLYVVESACTPTGAAADNRLALPPSGVSQFALDLAKKLGVPAAESLSANPQPGDGALNSDGDIRERWLEAVSQDLQDNRGAGIVLAGDPQPGWVHALVHAINERLANHNATISFIEPTEAEPTNQYEQLAKLVQAMNADEIQVLLVLGGNPVYNAPRELGFRESLTKYANSQSRRIAVHFSDYDDETSALCHWHIPAAHYLESWSDVRSFDGTASIVQPLIAPLYGGRTIHEMMSALIDTAVKPSYDLVRATWQEIQGEDFDRRWRKAVHDGVIADSASETVSVTLDIDAPALNSAIGERPAKQPANGELGIAILPDPTIFDGRFANNGWLQELPKPITKLTWDNAVLMSKATADRLGVAAEDLVQLTYDDRSIEGPVWLVPGHPHDSVTVYLGHGRWRGGRVSEGTGFDAYSLLPASGRRIGTGASIKKLGGKRTLACTEHHHLLEGIDVLKGRNIIHSGTLEEYKRDPQSVHVAAHADQVPHTLYREYEYQGLQWGMAIDMTACTGCNACVVACQAENNVPIVGKEGVIKGREMHWLRLDLYYEGEVDNPRAVHQPMLCQHCETAPCEVVCPVMATTHSAEGLNEMTYNRCVGTRYCSNNCPYKVRRFNFLEYNHVSEPVRKLLYNPEVTVRSRGVMEKCTYCVQRISAARIAAKVAQVDSDAAELHIEDGSLMTACQQACPSHAIVFGDINDPNSAVTRLKKDPRNYGVLSDIGTQPRTTYLAKLRNPHPELD